MTTVSLEGRGTRVKGREGNQKRGLCNRTTCDGKRDINTCDTCKWGKGFEQVAEGLPRPVPIYTLPVTHAIAYADVQ